MGWPPASTRTCWGEVRGDGRPLQGRGRTVRRDPDAPDHDLFYDQFRGHDGLRKLFDRMFAEGRDHVWTIDTAAEAASVAMAEWTFGFVVSDAVPRSAGRPLRFRGVSVFELQNGRCRTYREYFDKGPILVELGLQPDSLWRTLSRPPST